MNFIQNTTSGAVITVKVVPNASRDEIDCVLGDALKIRLQAPPVEGKANKALVKFLSKTLTVSKSDVILILGETSRVKRLLIRGVSANSASALLLPGKTP